VRARAGLVIPEEIDEQSVRSFLTTSELPDLDLLIRTGGEKRLSDFLLFESAYAELFFTETLWPDFTEATLDEAIAVFRRRERRYGRTPDQIRGAVAGGWPRARNPKLGTSTRAPAFVMRPPVNASIARVARRRRSARGGRRTRKPGAGAATRAAGARGGPRFEGGGPGTLR